MRLIRLGKPDDRFNAWPVRLREFLRDWLGQRKVLEDRLAGGAHALIFWGFLLLVSDVLDLGTGGMLARFLEDIYLKDVWNLLVDIGYLMAGTGITTALYRRVVLRPAKLRGASIEGEIILLAIMGIVLTAFVLEGAAMLSPDRAVVEHNGWEPVGTLFASFMAGMDGATLQTVVDVSYWLHMLLIGGFLIEIPQSKHSHLLGTIPNVLFQDHAPLGKQQPLQMAADGRAVSTDELDIENLVLGASNRPRPTTRRRCASPPRNWQRATRSWHRATASTWSSSAARRRRPARYAWRRSWYVGARSRRGDSGSSPLRATGTHCATRSP